MILAFEVQGLKPADKLLLLALADHANDKGECWPSRSTLARKTSMSIRTVQRSIKNLQDAGYLTVQNRASSEKGLMSNLYTIKLDPSDKMTLPPSDTMTLPYGQDDPTPRDTMAHKATNKKLPVEPISGAKRFSPPSVQVDTPQTEKPDVEPNRNFSRPTVQQVRDYCTERQNTVDPNRFVDFYESKGWLVGKSKMKCWKSAIRNWERTSKTSTTKEQRYAELDHAINDYETAKYNW